MRVPGRPPFRPIEVPKAVDRSVPPRFVGSRPTNQWAGLRWPARCGVVLIGMLVLVLSATNPAAAYWRSSGSGAAVGTTGTLAAPATVTVPAIATASVPVGWAASAGSPAPTGYYLTRDNGLTVAAACGSSPIALIPGTSCIDSAVAAGSYTYRVTAVYAGWTAVSPSSGVVTVLNPTRLAVTGQPTATAAGVAIAPPVAITVQSATGTPVPIPGILVTVSLGENPGAGALGGTLTRQTNAAGVATFPDLTVDKAAAGYRLDGTSPGLTSVLSDPFTVIAATASTAVITSTPLTGTAAATATLGPVTLAIRDQFGNPATAPTGGITTTLSTTATGTGVFSATLNGPTTTTVQIPTGSSTTSFYYGDTKAGTPTITATPTGITPTTQTATITAGTANTAVITSTPLTGTAAATATLGPVTLAIRDQFGNPATAPTGGITTTLTTTATGTGVFSATLNGPTTTTVQIPTGSSTTSFYYGDTKAGTPTITATPTGITPTTQTATITAGTANTAVITSTPLTGTAAATATLGPVTLAIRDQFGNPATAPTGGITTTLTTTATGTGVFSATLNGPTTTTVQIPTGSSTTSFYYGDTKAGTPTITATPTGITPAVTQTATITPATATQLIFGEQPTPVKKNRVITPAVMILIQDQFGNATSSTSSVTMAIGTNPGGATLNGTLSVAAVAGVATFSDLSLGGGNVKGSGYTLQATSTDLTSVTSTTFTVG